jgi:hypothetical protein
MRSFALALMLTLPLCSAALADQTPSAPGAEVYFIAPKDGERVKSPVKVVFGLKGMGVAPAGIKFDNTGHHHLLVDTDLPADLTLPLPASDNIRHFGKGQTETTLELPPGKHTLQLLFADYTHTPFTPNIASKKITITVTK